VKIAGPPWCPVLWHLYGSLSEKATQKHPKLCNRTSDCELMTDSESGSPVSYSSFLVTIRQSRWVTEIFTCNRQTNSRTDGRTEKRTTQTITITHFGVPANKKPLNYEKSADIIVSDDDIKQQPPLQTSSPHLEALHYVNTQQCKYIFYIAHIITSTGNTKYSAKNWLSVSIKHCSKDFFYIFKRLKWSDLPPVSVDDDFEPVNVQRTVTTTELSQ